MNNQPRSYMKNPTNHLLLLLNLPFLLALPACSQTVLNPQKLERLWTLTAVQLDEAADINSDGQKSTDAFAQYTACEQDQYLEFQPDGHLFIYNGLRTDACSAKEVKYTWQYIPSANPPQLVFSGPQGADRETFEVLQVTGSQLVVRVLVDDNGPQKKYATMTYRKIKKEKVLPQALP